MSQKKYIERTKTMKSTLILNASYEPLTVVKVTRAITLLYHDKATVEDASPFVMNTSNGEFVIPYVIRLKYEVKRKMILREPKFSRRGVLFRDSYVCGYCGEHGDTIDHVTPKALGGLSTYENCIAACKKCNHKKSSKTLTQMGWTIKQQKPATAPTLYRELLSKAQSNREAYTAWIEYVSWYDKTVKEEKEQLLLLNGIR
jgi:5-methylcytosine-specific restriction endonuclease McrA